MRGSSGIVTPPHSRTTCLPSQFIAPVLSMPPRHQESPPTRSHRRTTTQFSRRRVQRPVRHPVGSSRILQLSRGRSHLCQSRQASHSLHPRLSPRPHCQRANRRAHPCPSRVPFLSHLAGRSLFPRRRGQENRCRPPTRRLPHLCRRRCPISRL